MQTFTPLEYLKIDVASSFGLDKEDWDTRLNWFDEYEDKLESMRLEAEEPALFYAGLQAYKQAKLGKAIQYPISLDATASGAQILAILSGCERAALLSNVISSGHRLDFYTEITRFLNAATKTDVKVSRSDAKSAIMPSFYGSTKAPKDVFGEGELYNDFQRVMSIAAPGIWGLNALFLSLWDPNAIQYSWVLPDNFHAGFKVEADTVKEFTFMGLPHAVTVKEERPIEGGKALGANIIHSIDGLIVRELTARCNHDPEQIAWIQELLFNKCRNKKSTRSKDKRLIEILKHADESGYLSVRILDLIDDQNIGHVDPVQLLEMIKELPKAPFEVMSIHDCFRVHPNYGNDLRQQYNNILSDLAKSDMLNFLLKQLNGSPLPNGKSDILSKAAKVADYALS